MGKGKTTVTEPEETGLSPMDRLRDPAALRSIDFNDLVGQANEVGGLIEAAQAGDGYKLLDDKGKKLLVGKEFIITSFRPIHSQFGGYYMSATLRTKHPIPELGGMDAFRINDGGTGIATQLMQVWNAHPDKGVDEMPLIHCRKGLQVSEDYLVTEPEFDENGDPVIDPVTRQQKQKPRVDPFNGKEMHGTTFYLDTQLA